jgi:hypothetical protein
MGFDEFVPDQNDTPYFQFEANVTKSLKTVGQLNLEVDWATGIPPNPVNTESINDRFVGAGMFGNARAFCQAPAFLEAAPGTVTVSSPIIIKGLASFTYTPPLPDPPVFFPALTDVCCDSGMQVSVNGSTFSNGPLPIANGDELRFRMTSPATGAKNYKYFYMTPGLGFTNDPGFIRGYWTVESTNNARAPMDFLVGPTRTYTQPNQVPWDTLVAGDRVLLDNGNTYGPAGFKGTLTAVAQTVEYTRNSIQAAEGEILVKITGPYPNTWIAGIIIEQFNTTTSAWSGVQSQIVRNGTVIPAGAILQSAPITFFSSAQDIDNIQSDGRKTDEYLVQFAANVSKIRVRCVFYTSGTVSIAFGRNIEGYLLLRRSGHANLPITVKGVGPGSRAIIGAGGDRQFAAQYSATFDVRGGNYVFEDLEIQNGWGDNDCSVRLGGEGQTAHNNKWNRMLVQSISKH